MEEDTVYSQLINYALKLLNRKYNTYGISISEVREVWKFSVFLNFELPETNPEYQYIMHSLNELKVDVREIKEMK